MVASLSNPFDVVQCCLVGIRTWNCNSLNLIHIVYNWFLSLCPFGVRFNNAANRFQKGYIDLYILWETTYGSYMILPLFDV
jgi:hypothetical protein